MHVASENRAVWQTLGPKQSLHPSGLICSPAAIVPELGAAVISPFKLAVSQAAQATAATGFLAQGLTAQEAQGPEGAAAAGCQGCLHSWQAPRQVSHTLSLREPHWDS